MALIAQRQHGNVTTSQLNACGLDGTAIKIRVRAGRLFREHLGVYSVGRPATTPLERAAAAVLACGRGAALSHLGALALWGFVRNWPRQFEIVAVTGDPRPRGLTVHRYRGLTRSDLRVQHGIRATSPARTLLDCVPRLDDRARTRAVNDALHSPYVTRRQLADVRTRFPHHPGAQLLDPFLEQVGVTRSDLEVDFLAFCARHDLPRPRVNVRVGGYTVDALFEAHALIVELDSWEFHQDRRAFETDRERDAAHLALGLATVRVTHERLHSAADTEAKRLARILARRRRSGGA